MGVGVVDVVYREFCTKYGEFLRKADPLSMFQ